MTTDLEALATHQAQQLAQQRRQLDTLGHANATLWGLLEEARGSLRAMTRTAGLIADERSAQATDLLKLRLAAQSVVDSAARELNYSGDVLLVDAEALRKLRALLQGKRVSSNSANPAPAPMEETQEVQHGA